MPRASMTTQRLMMLVLLFACGLGSFRYLTKMTVRVVAIRISTGEPQAQNGSGVNSSTSGSASTLKKQRLDGARPMDLRTLLKWSGKLGWLDP